MLMLAPDRALHRTPQLAKRKAMKEKAVAEMEEAKEAGVYMTAPAPPPFSFPSHLASPMSAPAALLLFCDVAMFLV